MGCLDLFDLARLYAAGADQNSLVNAVYICPYSLKIGQTSGFGSVVRVGNIIDYHRLF